MTTCISETKAKDFLVQVDYSPTLPTIENYLKSTGWKFYYYNGNNTAGDLVIEMLEIKEYAQSHDAFTVDNVKHKIVFIRQNLPQNKTIKLLLHEIGHIMLGHTKQKRLPYLGWDWDLDEEANRFADYVLAFSQSPTSQIKKKKNKKKIGIAAILILAVAIIIGAIYYYSSFTNKYYLTATGNHYHIENCQYIEANDQTKGTVTKISKYAAKKDGYTPCSVCIGR